MVAVKRRRVEAAIGRSRPTILAEFHHILSHDILPDLPETSGSGLDHSRHRYQVPPMAFTLLNAYILLP
jgi:hypothetical protein